MEPCLVEKSRTDCALIEEASRYECALIPCGLMASRLSPSPLFFFGRTPGDFCDISGDDRGPSACKESSGKEMRLAQSMPRDGKGWEEECWEESELAKFRANDSSKRKVIKAIIRSQRVDLFCLQETKIQAMTEGLVRSLGTGRMRNVEDGLVWMFTGGDFNVTLSLRERSNQGRLTSAMRRFAQVVDELELIDLPLQGGMLTWSGGGIIRRGPDWIGLRKGPSPFRFENMWLKADEFSDLLRAGGKELRLEANKISALQQVEF
ncbi:hypothetical protein CK203_099674 [Vitis vinifera]|uniref:Endonuclease/exonuclease/phosphatase domain-containing protein n=1 Tax=Vitis vinifera TaxID=29760 RepID=A0A438F1Q9_VITVI|nr:hypothetical protein CK203_099674 [Vitis vinifera]